MNAVEIEQAISALVEQPFDPEEFPYLFLQAFGNKETTLKRLRKGEERGALGMHYTSCPSSDDLAQFGALNRGALVSSVG